MEEETRTSSPEEGRLVPLEWYLPETTPVIYANHLHVQHTEHEITLSFFVVDQPFLVGSDEDKRAQIEKIEKVRVRCLTQVVVSPSRAQAMIEALQRGLDNYRRIHGGAADES